MPKLFRGFESIGAIGELFYPRFDLSQKTTILKSTVKGSKYQAASRCFYRPYSVPLLESPVASCPNLQTGLRVIHFGARRAGKDARYRQLTVAGILDILTGPGTNRCWIRLYRVTLCRPILLDLLASAASSRGALESISRLERICAFYHLIRTVHWKTSTISWALIYEASNKWHEHLGLLSYQLCVSRDSRWSETVITRAGDCTPRGARPQSRTGQPRPSKGGVQDLSEVLSLVVRAGRGEAYTSY